MVQTYASDSHLQATQEWLGQAKALSASLASSPSQNEARRQDLVQLSHKASQSLNSFLDRTKAFNLEQSQGFLAVIKKLENLISDLSTKATKDLSWEQIDSQVGEIIKKLENAKKDWITEVEKQSQKLVNGVAERVVAFQPQELDEAAWLEIDNIISQATTATTKAKSFPLAPVSPWNAANLIQEQLSLLNSKIEALSGPVASQVERLTSQIGLPAQSGRKAVIWAETHKWILLVAAGLLLWFKSRNKAEI